MRNRSQTVEPTGGLDLGSTGRFGVSAWTPLPDSDTGRPTGPGASATEPVESTGPLP